METNSKRVPYPFKKDHDCIEFKVKCNCACHDKNYPSVKHIAPCCNNGYYIDYIDIKPNK